MIRKILNRAGGMCDLAYRVQKLTAISALILLLASLFLRFLVPELTVDTYPTYRLAQELFRMPAGILLAGIIAAVCIEDVRGNASR